MSTESEYVSQLAAYYLGESEQLRKNVAAMEAEVELLKSHTWQQERAAVILMFDRIDAELLSEMEKAIEWKCRDLCSSRCMLDELRLKVDCGEHWPQGGDK